MHSKHLFFYLPAYPRKTAGILRIIEHIFFSPAIARCRECGDALYDGDTAYRLGNAVYCPACVDAALTVCRPDDSWSEASDDPWSEASDDLSSEASDDPRTEASDDLSGETPGEAPRFPKRAAVLNEYPLESARSRPAPGPDGNARGNGPTGKDDRN